MSSRPDKPLILNVGSINIDHTYRVPHLVKPGETLASRDLVTGLGGKGANQSVALANAGASVSHIGRVSSSDQWAVELMASHGVDMTLTQLVDEPSGHAIIQVDDHAENAIVLHGGANQTFDSIALKKTLQQYAHADMLLLQNECNLVADTFEFARSLDLTLAFNPAPMSEEINALPLDQLDTLIVNQGEAQALTRKTEVEDIIKQLMQRLPKTRVVITLGKSGAKLIHNKHVTHANNPRVSAIDTTCAGDTFVGFFLAGLSNKLSDTAALETACRAASLAVTRPGAIASIPTLADL